MLHSDALVLKKLERIADKQKRISRYLNNASFGRDSLNGLDRIYMDITESYNSVMKAYYNREKETAHKIENTSKDRTELCNSFLEGRMHQHAKEKAKNSNSNLVVAARIVESLKATAIEIRDMARIVLCYE